MLKCRCGCIWSKNVHKLESVKMKTLNFIASFLFGLPYNFTILPSLRVLISFRFQLFFVELLRFSFCVKHLLPPWCHQTLPQFNFKHFLLRNSFISNTFVTKLQCCLLTMSQWLVQMPFFNSSDHFLYFHY